MVLSRAIVELARALGLDMVVESVESESQASWFASLGCRYAQGYWFARPLAPDGADRYLARAPRPLGVGAELPRAAARRRPNRSMPARPRNLRLVSGDAEHS